MLGLEPPDPRIDRRPRDLQDTYDADLGPTLVVEPDDLKAGVIAIRLGMVVHQGQLSLQGHGTGLPDRLHRLVINGMPKFNEQDAGEFAIVKPVIEGLEAIDLLPYGVRNGTRPPPVYQLDIRGQESRHALLPEAALEGAHRIWVGLRLLGPLGGGTIGEQHEGPNDLIAPLCLIDKPQLQLRKLRGRFHHYPFHPCSGRKAYVAYLTEAVTSHMARIALTAVGSDAGSPAPIRRPSPATGHEADMLDVSDPSWGYDAETCPYQPPQRTMRSTAHAGLLEGDVDICPYSQELGVTAMRHALPKTEAWANTSARGGRSSGSQGPTSLDESG